MLIFIRPTQLTGYQFPGDSGVFRKCLVRHFTSGQFQHLPVFVLSHEFERVETDSTERTFVGSATPLLDTVVTELGVATGQQASQYSRQQSFQTHQTLGSGVPCGVAHWLGGRVSGWSLVQSLSEHYLNGLAGLGGP